MEKTTNAVLMVHSFGETPPRTWRRHDGHLHVRPGGRNTSTDVEKTAAPHGATSCPRKHLHGRGEDHPCGRSDSWCLETPPRTWRRLRDDLALVRVTGNTSTDVEKTRQKRRSSNAGEKHLHGRGEDVRKLSGAESKLETPPRTWRRLSECNAARDLVRNTSTDVEKTRNE